MRYVKEVFGTVKRGCEVQLGPKTIIIGPNGSGKSTITNTLELSLSAEAYDVAGREHLAKEDLLLRHLGQEGKPLVARSVFDSGERAVFEIKRGKTGTSKKATHELPLGLDPHRLLPLRPLKEAVVGLPEKMRRFFVVEAVRGVDEKEIRKRLPTTLHSKYDEARAAVRSTLVADERTGPATPIDELIAIAALSKQRERKFADQSALSRSAASQLGAEASEAPSDEQIQQAEREVQDSQDALEEAVRRQTLFEAHMRAESNRQTALQNLEHVDAQIGILKESIEGHQRRIGELPAPPTPGVKACAEAAIFHAEKPGTQDRRCMVCGSIVPIVIFQERAEAARKRLAKSDEGVRRDLDAQIQAWQFDLKVAEDRREMWHNSANTTVPEPDQEPLSIEDARARVKLTNDRFREMMTSKKSLSAATASRGAALEQMRTSQAWGELSTAATDVVGLLMRQSVDGFVERVQKYLPKPDRFGLRLTETLCEYGLYHGDSLHTALSGGEGVRVLVALATACLRSDAAFPGVIIPEDRAWDPMTLGLALEAFLAVPAQVVLTSTIEPSAIPDGWTVVRLRLGSTQAPVIVTPNVDVDGFSL